MGCRQSTQGIDEGQIIKSSFLTQFFTQCYTLGFEENQILKQTLYKFEFDRETRQWEIVVDKQFLHSQYPVLLHPPRPYQFQELLNFIKTQIFRQEEVRKSLRYFPLNIANVLNKYDQFQEFDCEFLAQRNPLGRVKLKPNQLTLFISWKIYKEDNMNEFRKAIDLVEGRWKNLQLNLVGVIFDLPEKKRQYETLIQTSKLLNYDQIWIGKENTFFNDGSNNPYDNLAFQFFRFAQNSSDEDIYSIDNSLWLFSKSQRLIFVGRNNIYDQSTINMLEEQIQASNSDFTDFEQFQNSQVIKREKQFSSLSNQKTSIKQSEYRKVKEFILNKLMSQVLQGKQYLQIGDSYSLELSKETYFCNSRKILTIYNSPTFKGNGSWKYITNFQNIWTYTRSNINFKTQDIDLKRSFTCNKREIFQYLAKQMSIAKIPNIYYILERVQSINFNVEKKKFVLSRRLDGLHNVPVGASYFFKYFSQLEVLKQQIFIELPKMDYTTMALIQSFLSNQFGFSTSLQLNQLFCPIPNVFQIIHSEQVFKQRKILPLSQSILVASRIGSIQGSKQTKLPEDETIDYPDPLIQNSNEILAIYLVDYTKQEQVEDLFKLLNIFQIKNFVDSIRLVALSASSFDQGFDQVASSLELAIQNGILEIWQPIEEQYQGIPMKTILSKLYGLKESSRLLIIDQNKKVAFKGQVEQNEIFINKLELIVNRKNSQMIKPFDSELRERISQANHEYEWNKLKSFGYLELRSCKQFLDLEAYLQKNLMTENDIWSLQVRSFQIWDDKGNLYGKFYENPELISKINKSEIKAKFELLQNWLWEKFDKNKFKATNITERGQQNNSKQ